MWATMTYGMDRCLRLVREMRIKYKEMKIGKSEAQHTGKETYLNIMWKPTSNTQPGEEGC